jgi:hypothetical protein
MSDIDYSTTTQQKKIYTLLINYQNPKFPRTQKQICELLDLQKSSVSDAVKRLCDLKFIAPYSGMKTNILYRKGQNHKIIEAQISANFLEEGEWFDTYGHAVRPSTIAEPYKPTYRSHVNGHWLSFPVAVEGDLKEIVKKDFDTGKETKQAVFGDQPPNKEFKGSLNWTSSFYHEGLWRSIRYQKTARFKIFYIQPANRIQTAEELTPDEDLITPFIGQCKPILQLLEKYGGWKFKHTETGDYEVYSSVRQGRVQKEYGFDDLISGLLHDYAGDHGIIGESPWWYDTSPGAQGPLGEGETSKADYVDAFDKAPHTKATVEWLVKRFGELKRDNIQLKVDLLETENFLLNRQKTAYDIITIQSPPSEISETKTSSTGNSANEGMYQ